jgi:hypothetical protein
MVLSPPSPNNGSARSWLTPILCSGSCALAARHRLPTIYDRREFAEAGGLVSYGTDFVSIYRQAGAYANAFSEVKKQPISQSCNQPQTAKVLGLSVPSSLLTRADEVIESLRTACCRCSGSR